MVRSAHSPKRVALFCAVLSGLFAAYMATGLYAVSSKDSAYPFGDFFALWSYARIATAQSAATLYDFAALHAAQLELGLDPAGQAPFPYPPSFILLLAPLAVFSYGAAYLVWITTTLLLYLLATSAGRGPFLPLGLPLLLAPSTTITIARGQTGFLLAALLIGGLRLMDRRPVLAGILFGLLTYKPQFGLMVPLALIAIGNWRCLAAAALTALALLGATSAAWGWSIWLQWLHALPEYAAWFDGLVQRLGPSMPTVSANLIALGAPERTALWVQGVASLLAAILAWVAFRRFPRALAIPALLVATCIGTPHAFVYDLPLLSGAVLLFAGWRLQTGTVPRGDETAVLVLVLVLPALMLAANTRAPLSSLALGLFAAIVIAAGMDARRRFRPAPHPEIQAQE